MGLAELKVLDGAARDNRRALLLLRDMCVAVVELVERTRRRAAVRSLQDSQAIVVCIGSCSRAFEEKYRMRS